MEADTASLRKAAANWSLAGDKQLLEMLQKIHQKIMTKCEEANVKLDAMVDALDNASIDLQNVNNKFMALSNSQFVESRVYDDDVDVSTGENIPKVEPPKVDEENEITKLKHSLQRLEQMHEPVHILDSDSSDDEDEGRIILKPKEIYSHRPLPYIIGSQAWKNKWHAGLIQEESDSDSSGSKHDDIARYNDEYSESEPETAQTDKLAHRTISSSSMESELTSQPQVTSEVTRQPAKPADIAAELARRLGGQPLQLPASEPVPIETPPEPTTKKVYRVEKPATTTIFSDEPPPLDDYQSYKSDYTDDDDIFAELQKKPNPNMNRGQNRVAKNLFGGLSDNIVDDLFGEVETRDNDIGNVVDYQDVKSSASGRQKTSVLDERRESNSVPETPLPKQTPIETKSETEGAVKKPVGGISLFGSNKGAESIGAAILKRNQRKSSTSDEDTSNTENIEKASNIAKTSEEPVNKIIENLFSKPSKKMTKKEEIIRREEPANVKPAKDKIDLFSDNLFDDIDDIFTTNIVTKPKDNKPQKSIFDDDDLFADVTLKRPEKHNNKSDTKNIFDSNDALFSENENNLKTEVKIPSNPINVDKDDKLAEENVKVQSDKKKKQVASKSLFDDDSGDDLFSDVKIFNDISKPHEPIIENVKEVKNIILGTENKSSNTKTVNNDASKLLNNKTESKNLLQPVDSKLESPSLFDDDEFDDLFTTPTKSITEQSNLNNLEENKNIIEDAKTTETIDSNKNLRKEVIPQINDNTTGPMQKIRTENEKSESLNIIAESNVVVAEANNSHISDEKDKSKKTQSKENIADINEILDQKQDTRTPHFTDVDVNSKNTEHLKQSETSNKDFDNVLPSDSIPECSKLESTEPSILSDIFIDMPPAFEKPLEPKKSKNVNALFDDDSEDEALFFKKNEAISDEKPELNFSSDRFRIFHDEPPEIDIDFSQKHLKNILNPSDKLTDDNLFGGLPILQAQQTDENLEKENFKEVNKSLKNIVQNVEDKITNAIDITKLIEDSKESVKNQEINISKLLESFEENTQTDCTVDIRDAVEVSETETFTNKDPMEETEPRKSIGKLKPVNFNINVNSLLPGASLKKSKLSEETDGQTISTKSNEELNIHSPEKMESKMVKSVSFEGDPDSELLDNKLSKQRAKIQVKRRPSSRRARLEAVRKSRIELASDSTDNSSSFDEPPYKEIVNREKLEDTVDSTTTQIKSSSSDFFKENSPTLNIPNPANVISPSLEETLQGERDNFIKKNPETDVKSKVVYILNDEDIFNAINPIKEHTYTTESNKVEDKKVLDIVDDDDECLFKTPNISTLGKTYYKNKTVPSSDDLKTELKTTVSKESVQKSSGNVKDNLLKTKKSLFEDLSDDENELFGGSKKPAVQRTNIFDSDSEGELFVKTKRENKTVELKKETVKGSLFGDGSDDDSDLFGVKAEKKSENVRQNVQKPKEVVAKVSEPVFEDPLSMFGDDS